MRPLLPRWNEGRPRRWCSSEAQAHVALVAAAVRREERGLEILTLQLEKAAVQALGLLEHEAGRRDAASAATADSTRSIRPVELQIRRGDRTRGEEEKSEGVAPVTAAAPELLNILRELVGHVEVDADADVVDVHALRMMRELTQGGRTSENAVVAMSSLMSPCLKRRRYSAFAEPLSAP
jgi:hypothetical protein